MQHVFHVEVDVPVENLAPETLFDEMLKVLDRWGVDYANVQIDCPEVDNLERAIAHYQAMADEAQGAVLGEKSHVAIFGATTQGDRSAL